MSQEEDDKRSVSSAAMETGNLFIKTSFRCEMVVFISSFIHGVKKISLSGLFLLIQDSG